DRELPASPDGHRAKSETQRRPRMARAFRHVGEVPESDFPDGSRETDRFWQASHPTYDHIPGALLTAPLAIQRPAAMRARNATFDGVQCVAIGPIEPANSASPRALSGTKTVSKAKFAPPGSQTSVPLT